MPDGGTKMAVFSDSVRAMSPCSVARFWMDGDAKARKQGGSGTAAAHASMRARRGSHKERLLHLCHTSQTDNDS